MPHVSYHAFNPHEKNIHVRLDVKVYKIYFRPKLYIQNIFHIYFRYIFAKIYLPYIQNILEIYLNDAEIYFRGQKLYVSYMYFISI